MGDAVSGTLRDHLRRSRRRRSRSGARFPRCCRRSALRRRSSCCSRACSTATPSCAIASSPRSTSWGRSIPERRIDRRLIETVLGAEDHGSLPLVPGAGQPGRPSSTPHDPVVQGLRESMQQEAERIFRLLEDPVSRARHAQRVRRPAGRRSRRAGQRDRVPRSDACRRSCGACSCRCSTAASRLLSAVISPTACWVPSLGDREEAIAVMMLSQDPWLQSCAAYAIGEFRLSRFVAIEGMG